MERDLSNFDDVNDLPNGTTKIVHSGSQNKCRSTNTSGSTPSSHPVTVHPLDDLGSLVGDTHGQTTKLQALGKAVDEILWIDRIHQEQIVAKPEFVEQSLVRLTEFEDVNLHMVSIRRSILAQGLVETYHKDIREIHKHCLVHILSSAGDV